MIFYKFYSIYACYNQNKTDDICSGYDVNGVMRKELYGKFDATVQSGTLQGLRLMYGLLS